MRRQAVQKALAIAGAMAAAVTLAAQAAPAASAGTRGHAGPAMRIVRATHRTPNLILAGGVVLYGCDAYDPCVTPWTPVNIRTDTNTGSAVVGVLDPGQYVGICQVIGQDIGGNYIWDGMNSDQGAVWVTDYYMNTPSYGTSMYAPCYGKG